MGRSGKGTSAIRANIVSGAPQRVPKSQSKRPFFCRGGEGIGTGGAALAAGAVATGGGFDLGVFCQSGGFTQAGDPGVGDVGRRVPTTIAAKVAIIAIAEVEVDQRPLVARVSARHLLAAGRSQTALRLGRPERRR